jgi:hypothetical protein
MPDLVKRLGLAAIATTATTLYTVPAATTGIVRHIRIVNSTASTVNVVMSIGLDAIGTRVVPTGYQIGSNGTLDITGSIILNAGETLQATASIATALTAYVGGVEVT